jgi:hypothetical protein
MQTFLEYFASPDQHPLHSAALTSGFSHGSTTSKLGVTNHEYSHQKGHGLTLHTHPEGGHSFTMRSARGKEFKGNTPMHFMGAKLSSGVGTV